MIAGAVAVGATVFVVGAGVLSDLIAGLTVLAGCVWLGLGLLAAQSRQEPAVAIGKVLLDFTAPDENGESFSMSSLRGHPVLLRFFRGHW